MSNQINKEMTIGSILEGFPDKSPALAEVMTSAGLHCVGCGAALFETLEQGIMGHGMSPDVVDQVVAELNSVLDANEDETEESTTPEPVSRNSNPVVLTEKAISKVKALLEEENMTDYGLRVGIAAGGCAGFSYILNFEEKSMPEDMIFLQDGIKIFIDPDSAQQLKGTTIDYSESLKESGFKFDNPSSKGSCGCGSSFS